MIKSTAIYWNTKYTIGDKIQRLFYNATPPLVYIFLLKYIQSNKSAEIKLPILI